MNSSYTILESVANDIEALMQVPVAHSVNKLRDQQQAILEDTSRLAHAQRLGNVVQLNSRDSESHLLSILQQKNNTDDPNSMHPFEFLQGKQLPR